MGRSSGQETQASPPDQASEAPNIPSGDGGNAPPSGASQENVSFQTFYDSLASQGTWIQNPDYGYIWQPTVADANWAPYSNGHWVYTEDGWTWVSNDPWGWATCHYGRWVNLDSAGWCWVPGYTWGPAWVSWRYGDGYAGWAPLPPDSLVGIDYAYGDTDYGDGFHIGGDCDSYFGIGPGWYNFIPAVCLGDSDYRGYYSNRRDNSRIVSRTTNVTNININRRERTGSFSGVSLGGPSYLQANARSRTPIARVNLAYTERVGGGAVEGDSLALFAPRVDVHSLSSARPAGTVRSMERSEVNRGNDLTRPLVGGPHVAATASSTEVHHGPAVQPAVVSDRPRSTPAHSFNSMHPIGSFYETGYGGAPSTQRAYSNGAGAAPYGNSGAYRPGGVGPGVSNPRYSPAPSYRQSGGSSSYRSGGAPHPSPGQGGSSSGQHK